MTEIVWTAKEKQWFTWMKNCRRLGVSFLSKVCKGWVWLGIVWMDWISKGWAPNIVQIQPEREFGHLSPWECKSDHGLCPNCTFLQGNHECEKGLRASTLSSQREFSIPNPAASCEGFSCIQNISLGPFMIFGSQNLPKYLWAFSLLRKFSPNSLDKLFSADGLLWIACEFFTLTSVLCLLGGLISSWAEWLKCLQGRKNEHRILNKKQCISRTNIFSWLFSQTLSEISSNRCLPCAFWMLLYVYACKPNSSHSPKGNCELLNFEQPCYLVRTHQQNFCSK